MKNQNRILLLTTLGLLAFLPAPGTHADDAPAANLLPLNDNTAAPFMGVYRWGQSGLVGGLYDAYPKWLNRSIIWGEDFMPTEGWDKIEGQGWQMGPWGDWINKVPGRRYILSVPILVGSWDGKGPRQGPAAGVAVSLEEGAKGTYNIYFQHLAESLVKHGLANSILRIGWEFNGGWYIWRTGTEEKAQAYAGYFRQIVTTMRSVPGADKLQFDWNPAMETWWPYAPDKAYPGDDVVDYIGVDVYDQSWAKDTYPIPPDATDDQALERQKRTWSDVTDNEKASGLPFWVKFAADHHKPLTIPEWGACIRSDKHGGNDNTYFIQKMHDFILDPANNVYFASYFDVTAGDGDHRLVQEVSKKDPTNIKESKLPKSAALFQQLFSLPASPTASASTTPVKSATGTP